MPTAEHEIGEVSAEDFGKVVKLHDAMSDLCHGHTQHIVHIACSRLVAEILVGDVKHKPAGLSEEDILKGVIEMHATLILRSYRLFKTLERLGVMVEVPLDGEKH
jgi:hypothetical protein